MSQLSVGDIFAGKPETKQERRGPSNIAYPEKSPVKSGAFPSKRNYFTAWVEIRPGFDNHEFYQIVKVMFLLSLRWICGDSLISLSRITNKLETLRYMANRFSHKKIRGKITKIRITGSLNVIIPEHLYDLISKIQDIK